MLVAHSIVILSFYKINGRTEYHLSMFDLAGAKLRLLYEILLFVRNECQLILQFKYAFLVAVVFCLQLTGFNYQRWNIIAIETKQKAFQQLLVDSYTNWAVRLLHFSPFKCKLKKFHLQKLNGVVWDSNRGPLVSEATMKPVDKHRTKSLVLLLPFIGILPTPKASQPKWSEVARIIFLFLGGFTFVYVLCSRPFQGRHQQQQQQWRDSVGKQNHNRGSQ